MPRTFGYSPEKSEHLKVDLDLTLRKQEFWGRHLIEIIPDAGAITARVDEALEILRGVVADLHDVVDERTEESAAAEHCTRPPAPEQKGGRV